MQYDAKRWATIHLGRKHYKAIQNSKIKHTSRYNIAQHNSITYIWIQCYTVQHDALQFNTTQRSTTQHDAMRCKALRYTQKCYTMMYNRIENNTRQHNTVWPHTSQTNNEALAFKLARRNAVQCNTIPSNIVDYNPMAHKTMQYDSRHKDEVSCNT